MKSILTTAATIGAFVAFVMLSELGTRHGLAALTLMGLSTVASAQAQSASMSHFKIEPAIVRASDDYLKAVLAGDARAVAAVYRDDAIEMPNGAAPVKGRAAIEQRYREMFKGVKLETFTFTHIEAFVEGDLGFDAGTYEQRFMLPTGQAATDVGKYLVILKRTQGQWKAAYVIYNSDTAPGSRVNGQKPQSEKSKAKSEKSDHLKETAMLAARRRSSKSSDVGSTLSQSAAPMDKVSTIGTKGAL
jgi:uncharacterized protein (TIGR02246 family)